MSISREEFEKELGLENISQEDEEYVAELHELSEKRFREDNEDREEDNESREKVEAWLKTASNKELMVYVPDIYQHDIYSIDYERLKDNGIKLITFDIDDTIEDSIYNKLRGIVLKTTVTMPEEAKFLFRYLKQLGFKVALLTNTREKIAKDVCKDLDADGYIAKAKKPEDINFINMMNKFNVTAKEMAHVGNSMRDDIVGGNRAGVTTCLVRRNGVTIKIWKKVQNIAGRQTLGQIIREELLKRDIWRKQHKFFHNDQYYQLGEEPRYRSL